MIPYGFLKEEMVMVLVDKNNLQSFFPHNCRFLKVIKFKFK